ncbi:MAG: hypothetical protein Q8P05_05960 [Candidatus Diapherotrites archaeon]|nr:hypothetical protein [Candidatus Diapherotrites archaeon]MDZ4256817.1 hypothetical protein [archaeon]
MQAVIEVEELRQDWKPPFAKKRELRSHSVKEGDQFEVLKNGSYLFTVDAIQESKVQIAYNRLYTLKGYAHPSERKVWLDIHSPTPFASLWEDNGITKTVTLREVRSGETIKTPQPTSPSSDGNPETPASPPAEEEPRPSFEVLRQQAREEIAQSKYSTTVTNDTEIYRPR